MLYRITHTTEYRYQAPVSHCYNLAHIIPRTSHRQTCLHSSIDVTPAARFKSTRDDYFGNRAFHFEIQRSHELLNLTAQSTVETRHQYLPKPLNESMTVAEARQHLRVSKEPDTLLAREFKLDSPMITAFAGLKDYALPFFAEDRPLLDATMALTQAIYRDFTYSPEATTLSTPLEEVLSHKKGVCQDFAHLQIGCLRALGFAAKYVSGYIETLPAIGKEKLVGTDASHAWLSLYCPHFGWIEFDPTNNCLVGDQHILTAWGRDYYDVTPLRGVIFGGGETPSLSVSVDVSRVHESD